MKRFKALDNIEFIIKQVFRFTIQMAMSVLKRNGFIEEVSFDKVVQRIKKLSDGLSVNVFEVAQKVCSRIYDGVKTSELDELAAQMCSSLALQHLDYGTLASRIIVSNHQKNTSPSFSETIITLYNNKDSDGNPNPLISDDLFSVVMANKEKLNSYIDYSRDFVFDYFGFKTLEKSYLLRVQDYPVERPQHMFMRVALGIHGKDIKDALQTYDLMSQKYFVHATPTLFNSGTRMPQLSSCFLEAVEHDSIDGIFNTLKDCAIISKYAGGIGLHVHNVRARNSVIRGTNGICSGIVPMLRVYNSTARYVNQAGKRLGSIAIYIEPWHADIEMFINMRKNHGNEEERARDLFYALWIPDLFMERVHKQQTWSLMCPDKCPGLCNVYGDEFKILYEKYEAAGHFVKQVDAQKLWFKILENQIETGTPYMLYKDHVNRKNNQSNLGVIKSSNLCTEIVEYSDDKETAVCNLASICLPTYYNVDTKQFDYNKLLEVVKVITKNLNKVIDVNFYPIEKAYTSNKRHRPIGIGVQGLADLFAMMEVPFDSDVAVQVNKDIFETIYYGAVQTSVELAKRYGSYETFKGSPASEGKLQFDLWNVDPGNKRYDWDSLKKDVVTHGMRNSLLVAPMPTASTSQIMGFNEAFEPFTSNIYKRKTLAGEFILINKYLIRDLEKIGLWNTSVKNQIITNEGSIQSLQEIPESLKQRYKTVWEIKMRHIIDMAADRAVFIDQSQSMNLFLETPNYQVMTAMHFYAWNKGLKTGMYYLRTKSKAKVQQFTIEPTSAMDLANLKSTVIKKVQECNDEVCTSCSS